MSLTYTPKAQIGTACPDFKLPAVNGTTLQLSSFRDAKGIVIMFICNHCPYVKSVEDRIIDLAREMIPQGIAFVAICSNDATDYPEDSFANIKQRWHFKKYPFPYLYDEDQDVAFRFGAVCTPDFFVYNQKRRLVYRGQLDDSWKDASKVTKQDLRDALIRILENQLPLEQQTPSMGCSIKWRQSDIESPLSSI